MTTLSADQKKHLDEEGYILFPGLLSPEEIAQIGDRLEKLWAAEGAAAGRKKSNALEPDVRRLANLANHGDIFRRLLAHPLVIAAAEAVMGPDVRLSMLNARQVPPHFGGQRQAFHTDTDNAGKPDEKGFYSCTAIWMLDPFTPENGATRLAPATHHSGAVPQEVLPNVHAAHPQEIILTGQAGDVAVFNGHCWHADGVNHTDRPRRAILAHYLRADIPRPNDRRQQLSAEVKARLSASEATLLGVGEKQYLARLKHGAENFFKSLKTRLPV